MKPEKVIETTTSYYCKECHLTVPSGEVRWSARGEALCPRCEFPLGSTGERPRKTAAHLPSVPEGYVRCEECHLLIAEAELHRNADGRAFCPRCEWPLA